MKSILRLAALIALASAVVPSAGGQTAPSGVQRLSDGSPDLSGYWQGGQGGGGAGGGGQATPDEDGDVFAVISARDGDLMNFENDSYIEQKAEENLPIYRPEFWDKVRDLDLHGNTKDPAIHCLPNGVPRSGPPTRIISLPGEVILFNGTVFRIIKPGKPRDKAATLVETWNGIPEARWQGDTLIIESVAFNDQSWLGWGGFFHGFDLKVTETIRRSGDTLFYSAVADDPEHLQQPWIMDPVTLRRNTNPNATIAEAAPCIDRDSDEIPNNIRG